MNFGKHPPWQLLERCFLVLSVLSLLSPLVAKAQTAGNLRGSVFDPSGAVIPGAVLMLRQGSHTLSARSGRDGSYSFRAVPEGLYSLVVDAQGFAPLKMELQIIPNQTRQLNLSLPIAVQQENVQSSSRGGEVNVNPGENAGAIVLSGSDLDALSDDPNQFQSELKALAGPAAGPDGGQIYIDGFTGGQLPPRSSVREIRINQNPFSAEFDRLGYGRLEILTKPGTDKLSGYLMSFAVLSALNTANPLIKAQPSYYGYSLPAYVSGPLTKRGSYFFSFFHNQFQNQSVVVAVDPLNPATTVNQAVPHPSSLWNVNPRIDLQLGKSNTLSIREAFTRSLNTADGVGALNLPEQAYNVNLLENALQISNTIVINSKLLNDTHFQWRKIRNSQVAAFVIPEVMVQGAFTTGGNDSGVIRDHQDIFELQNNSTAIAGSHTIRWGARLRVYRDANDSTAGANGTYIFQSVSHYLAKQPDQYQATLVNNALARVLLFDAALFVQEDWRWRPNFALAYGLRYEGQNRIRDHADWAPRIALAWAPEQVGKTPPMTVLRAGYGWFYDRFTVPGFFSSATGTPYVIQAIHQNGINQQSYVIGNPGFYDPEMRVPPDEVRAANASLPAIYTIDSHFHAALEMQGGAGVDRQLGKFGAVNMTYLFTHGIHQYFSNNVTAPEFDPFTYVVTGPLPNVYNYQFQSEGVYRQHQLIVIGNTRFHRMALHTSYTFNEAKSDAQGVNSFPSVAGDPRLDYGRPAFDIHHRITILGTYSGAHKIILAPMLIAQSGTPYNISIGSDLTANNQFNARPTYGTCGAPDVISTRYGCLDTDPINKREKMIPYGVGTGPANVVFNLRASKAFGIGARVKDSHGATAGRMGFSVSGGALGGGQDRSRVDAEIPRRYTLTLIVSAYNLFNIVNRGAPNGVLSSTLFGSAQSLAGGPFQSLSSGNRTVLLQTSFNF